MTARGPTAPPWWPGEVRAAGIGQGFLFTASEYKEVKRKQRKEQEAAHAAAGRNPKSQASMERRARRKGAVPPQFSQRGRGRPKINSLEAWRLGQKVMEVRYAKNCGFHAAYRHPPRPRASGNGWLKTQIASAKSGAVLRTQ